MTSMQTKILAAIAQIAERHHLDAPVQYRWANTGTVLMQSGFDTLLELHFDFQDVYVGLTFSGPSIEAAELEDNPPEYRFEALQGRPTLSYHMLKYNDGPRILAMLELVGRVVAEHVDRSA